MAYGKKLFVCLIVLVIVFFSAHKREEVGTGVQTVMDVQLCFLLVSRVTVYKDILETTYFLPFSQF